MAEKFLELVAKDLLQTYGNNLSRVTVVIPGKRARLFMNQYLAEQSQQPVWSPRYQTIDELFLELSPYKKAEQIETVCLLYKIYSQLVENPEQLDEFYSWGEIILSDFDDIDKHLAPAEKIFANVYDLHAIQQDYLTPEQEAALKEFFSNFSIEGNTELKRRFLRLWEIMPKLYERLREQLRERGYLYSGALYRDVVERHKELTLEEGKTYAFVGFNVVDECEEALFRLLGEEHTRFYWDYDMMYVKNPDKKSTPWEAGLFLRQNLSAFPNRLLPEHFDNLKHLQDITFISTSTDNAQARYLPTWIKEQLTPEENDTAIVLCDEHQLQPVLHALPEDMPHHINITMGFPLTDTPIYSFLSIVTAMQIDGWDAAEKQFRNTFQEKVRRHPYFAFIKQDLFEHQPDNLSLLNYLQELVCELGAYYAQRIQKEKSGQDGVEAGERKDIQKTEGKTEGKTNEKTDVYDQLYSEALFQTHKVLNRFIALIEENILDVHPVTLRRLIRNVLGTTSIPFHGEPAIGMQVMGLMETRNLDFRHLLMLNVGEGTMPKKSDDNSLIPYTLREAFGLTTIQHRISVFAYYFFRLLQRTTHVTLMYNENSSGVKNNEMSRFMRQLMAETNLPIRHIRLTPTNAPTQETITFSAAKSKGMVAQLLNLYLDKTNEEDSGCGKAKEPSNGNAKDSDNKVRPFSPTAINTYLNCPLQFYFKYMAGIKVEPQIEDGITAAEVGTFFHNAAESFYRSLAEKYGTNTFTADMLRPALEHKETQLAKHIDMGEYKGKTGLPLIIRNVILEYLCQLVRYDLQHAPVTIREMETDYWLLINIAPPGEKPQVLRIGGRVDRLDSTANGLLVVDYKTGGKPEPIESVEGIFTHKAKNAGYYFQTILYALAVKHKHHLPVKPSLFYVHQANDAKTYDSSLMFKTRTEQCTIEDVASIEQEFCEKLTATLQEIFNPDIPFTQTENEEKCQYCDYRKFCAKRIKRR